MPSVLNGVFTLSTGVFCFGVYFFVRLLRELMEAKWPSLLKNATWKDVVLPTAPIAFGGLIALVASSYPYPSSFTGVWGRVAFGIVMGGFSGWAYRIFKKIVVKQFGVADTSPPPPDPSVPSVVIPKHDGPPVDPDGGGI